MISRRFTFMLALTLAWGWGAWHEDLEAAGWMLEHQHLHHSHHETAERGAHEHPPGAEEHSPFWARDVVNDSRLLPLVLLLFVALALPGLRSLVLNAATAEARIRTDRKRRSRASDPPWHFVRRCAPDVAAPPALS